MFFTLSSLELALVLVAILGAATVAGYATGAHLREHPLWGLAGQAIARAPVASADRLYVDSLNSTIDQQGVRIAALTNRVPNAVLALELIADAAALGLLALHIAILGRGLGPLVVAAALIMMILLVTFDLDRPTRGLISVPDTPLVSLRASMVPPPAAHP